MNSLFACAREVLKLLRHRLPDTQEAMEDACRTYLLQQDPPLVSDVLVRKLQCAVADEWWGEAAYDDWRDDRILELEFENELLRLRWFHAVDLAANGASTTSAMILKLALNGCLSGPPKA